ncbi:hypothetical protein [Celeribacter litoreus]|uniref:hypothetical protein n=1 Tax=Celeribacter litoreus TaxID=2876714 RepID=UPI001CCB8866|nr:hypothetical protein [Celeribacter litoreus]MCA0045078.1 hypothetical protein [Celeribacter litoreus]
MFALKPLRAEEHRSFIGPEFGAGADGVDPQTVSYVEITSDPKMSALARKVYEELRVQFSQPDAFSARAETSEEEAYRRKLEGWADMLEILLEETLAELDAINAQMAGNKPEF